MQLGYFLGTLAAILLLDALFLDGMIRKWAVRRIRGSRDSHIGKDN